MTTSGGQGEAGALERGLPVVRELDVEARPTQEVLLKFAHLQIALGDQDHGGCRDADSASNLLGRNGGDPGGATR